MYQKRAFLQRKLLCQKSKGARKVAMTNTYFRHKFLVSGGCLNSFFKDNAAMTKQVFKYPIYVEGLKMTVITDNSMEQFNQVYHSKKMSLFGIKARLRTLDPETKDYYKGYCSLPGVPMSVDIVANLGCGWTIKVSKKRLVRREGGKEVAYAMYAYYDSNEPKSKEMRPCPLPITLEQKMYVKMRHNGDQVCYVFDSSHTDQFETVGEAQQYISNAICIWGQGQNFPIE